MIKGEQGISHEEVDSEEESPIKSQHLIRREPALPATKKLAKEKRKVCGHCQSGQLIF